MIANMRLQWALIIIGFVLSFKPEKCKVIQSIYATICILIVNTIGACG